MDQSHDTPSFPNPTRRDGWTPELKARFLANLAENGNARLAARRCGMSAQSAYVQRRRDPEFSRAWAAAMRLAREHCAQVLADRALEGVEEPIWYRGELVGTRRRYDTRLLLAHMARLDRLERDEQAEADTGRFDEMLALIAGDKLTGALIRGADFVPRDRHQHGVAALQAACEALALEPPPADGDKVDAYNRAQLAQLYALRDARQEWDAWRERANATVDRVTGAADTPADPVLADHDAPAETQAEVDTLTQSWGANSEPAQPAEAEASPSSPARGGEPPERRWRGLSESTAPREGATPPARRRTTAPSTTRCAGGPPPRAGEDGPALSTQAFAVALKALQDDFARQTGVRPATETEPSAPAPLCPA